jgi:hypothetical protein
MAVKAKTMLALCGRGRCSLSGFLIAFAIGFLIVVIFAMRTVV